VSARLSDIYGRVQRVRDVINEIASANEQQATGVAQITTAVEQVGRITQETADTAEQSHLVAARLTGEAERLDDVLSASLAAPPESRPRSALNSYGWWPVLDSSTSSYAAPRHRRRRAVRGVLRRWLKRRDGGG
jgi:hypothetical protein